MNQWRENIVLGTIFLVFLVFIFQLYSIQIKKGNYYKALSEGLTNFFEEIFQPRGKIYFADGEILATNKEFFSLVLIPEIFKKENVSKLASILGMEEEKILNFLKEKSPQIIKEDLKEQEIEKIKRAKIKGIYFKKEIIRVYPQGEIASRIVGFQNKDGKGQYGLEEFYDEKLKRGENLILTLKLPIQLEAERLLKENKEKFDFEEGEIIVADPKSGEILALANFPNFNPNQFFNEDFSLFKNLSSQNLFEPGSVFKPITFAMALEEKKITPQETYEDKGIVKIDGWEISNYGQRKYGLQTMTNVLEKSINTGAVFVAQKIGKEKFLEYFEKFGFSEKSGLDNIEVFSQNWQLKNGGEINLATASFGQGIEVNSLQLLNAFAAIANGGKLIKPHLVKKIISNEGEIEIQPEIKRQVLSPQTSKTLTEMLVSVVENGFGKRAKIDGFLIAGKTGTAQIPLSVLGLKTKGYSEKTIQSFIGFFPVKDPQFLVLVKLKNPNTKTAEYSATPIFNEISKFIITHYKIPLDNFPKNYRNL